MFSSLTGSKRMLMVRVAAAYFHVIIVLLLPVTGCSSTSQEAPGHAAVAVDNPPAATAKSVEPIEATPVLNLKAMLDLRGLVPQLVNQRVVFVGETHDRYDHHLAQLEIIRSLHALDQRLAIGMEAFQQPFQSVLDDYIDGKLTEQEMLQATEYFDRWRLDYRLYAPILRFAREQGIPLVALNLPVELTTKVGREGLDSLTDDERAQLPTDIDRSDKDYEERLRKVFRQHPNNGRSFESFMNVQLLWDEGMAERAAEYLTSHTDTRMVILAGSGHLAWGSGIPKRLARRVPVPSATVLNSWEGELSPDLADFVLLTKKHKLQPAGKFGALLETKDGALTVRKCLPDSPCKRAGLRRGDQFVSIDGETIADMSDLNLVMWNKLPGDTVKLLVKRARLLGSAKEQSYSIELR